MGVQEKVVDTASELIKKEASSIMGMLFPYVGLRKKALDMYISDVEKSNMSNESKVIAVLNAKNTIKKLKNQKRIAEIALENSKEGTDFTNNSGVDEEWLERFMDSAKFVSDGNVQFMWGKILSNEFENPGSTPPSIIRVLSEITPFYAQIFRKICSMQIILVNINKDGTPLSTIQNIVVPHRENQDALDKIGLSFENINELENLGLVKFDALSGYIRTDIPEGTLLSYVNGKTDVIISHKDNELPIGNVILTEAGKYLKNITQLEVIDGYEDMVKRYMMKNGVKYMDEPNYQIEKNQDEITVHIKNK